MGSCTAWRQVRGPSGQKGARDYANDLACEEIVPENAAGYCECPTGFFYYDSGHNPLTCASACAGPRPYYLGETTNVADEYHSTQLDYGAEPQSVARAQTVKRALAVGLLVVVGFLLFHSSIPKSDRTLYLERRITE